MITYFGCSDADGINVLVHGVRRSHVPVRAHPLHRRQNLHKLAQLLRHNAAPAFADMPVQRQSLVLGQDVHPAQIGVDAVGERDIDDPVVPPKGTAGLARSRVSGKRRSPAPPASRTPSVSFIVMASQISLNRSWRAADCSCSIGSVSRCASQLTGSGAEPDSPTWDVCFC